MRKMGDQVNEAESRIPLFQLIDPITNSWPCSAGYGTDGGNGGNGGVVIIEVSEHDTNLLLAVDWDVSGGRGGDCGIHGNPGEGGQGGEGGAGFTWYIRIIHSLSNYRPLIFTSMPGKHMMGSDMLAVGVGECARVKRYVSQP